MSFSHRLIPALVGLSLFISACTTAPKATVRERQQAITDMGERTLEDLYEIRPEAREEIARAPGYATFSNVGLKAGFLGAGGGRGLVVDNHSGKVWFMNMAEAGGGLGLGIKRYRAVFVFHDTETLRDFLQQGVTVGASANATAKLENRGEAAGATATVNRMSVYEITDDGLAAEAMITGARYWMDDDLN